MWLHGHHTWHCSYCVFKMAGERSSARHARDLGVDVSFGNPSIPIARKRAKRASIRARRIRGLAKKHARASRILFKGDYRKAQKKRRGSSGDAVKEEGQVLHYLCWADDLYAMAGAMNHLTRILEDMTNAIERLGMRWKEKSLTIVAGPFTEYKPGDVVEIISNNGIRGIWRVVEGMEALGTWLDNRGCSGTESPKPTPCSTRRRLCSAIPNCQSKNVLTPSTRRVYQLRSMLLVSGPAHSQCSRYCAFGNWSCPVLAHETKRVLGRLHETYWCHCCPTAQETQSTTRADSGYETCSNCCLADGELPERCEGTQILGRIL